MKLFKPLALNTNDDIFMNILLILFLNIKYIAYSNYMESRFSRFAENPVEIDRNRLRMNCEKYYFR